MDMLGLNAFHGDPSAAFFFRNGELVAALEEERLNRIKHWAGLPVGAAKWCLNGAQPDYIAISRDPKAHLTDKDPFDPCQLRWHRHQNEWMDAPKLIPRFSSWWMQQTEVLSVLNS